MSTACEVCGHETDRAARARDGLAPHEPGLCYATGYARERTARIAAEAQRGQMAIRLMRVEGSDSRIAWLQMEAQRDAALALVQDARTELRTALSREARAVVKRIDALLGEP